MIATISYDVKSHRDLVHWLDDNHPKWEIVDIDMTVSGLIAQLELGPITDAERVHFMLRWEAASNAI